MPATTISLHGGPAGGKRRCQQATAGESKSGGSRAVSDASAPRAGGLYAGIWTPSLEPLYVDEYPALAADCDHELANLDNEWVRYAGYLLRLEEALLISSMLTLVLRNVPETQERRAAMPVGEYCNREVIIAEKGTSVREAARLMRNYHTGDLVVVECRGGENFPVGIVTDRDLVIEVLAEDAPLEQVTLADLLCVELATVQESEELWLVLNRMRTLGVRRMPVVNARGVLVGILTMDDAVELIAEALSDMAQLVRREIKTEVRRRPPAP